MKEGSPSYSGEPLGYSEEGCPARSLDRTPGNPGLRAHVITVDARGRLAMIIRRWNEWVEVKLIVYDIPNVQTAWVLGKMLTRPSQVEPAEGFLVKGAEVWQGEFSDVGRAQPEVTDCAMSVYFTETDGQYIRVNAAGGWAAWTKKANIVFDPGVGN